MLVVVLGANGLDDDAADETTVDVKRAMAAERTFIVYGMCSKGAMSMMYDVYCCVCCCVAVGVWGTLRCAVERVCEKVSPKERYQESTPVSMLSPVAKALPRPAVKLSAVYYSYVFPYQRQPK